MKKAWNKKNPGNVSYQLVLMVDIEVLLVGGKNIRVSSYFPFSSPQKAKPGKHALFDEDEQKQRKDIMRRMTVTTLVVVVAVFGVFSITATTTTGFSFCFVYFSAGCFYVVAATAHCSLLSLMTIQVE